MYKPRITALLIFYALSGVLFSQDPFVWNKEVPIKRPAENNNGKLILFDVSHGGTQGNADWVIDGGFSDFADALVAEGYTVQEYRGVDMNCDGLYTFVDDRQIAAISKNEAIISFDAIKHADVFVLAETNRPLRIDEYAALKQFVDAGKGIFFVSDHYNADRNLNTWDSTEVFNGYNRSNLARYNMEAHYGDQRNPQNAHAGWLAENFGVRFRFNAVDWKPGASSIMNPDLVEGLTEGAGPVLIAAGGTISILDPTKAKGLVYFSDSDDVEPWQHAVDRGMYFGGLDEGPVVAISKPGAGKAAFIGDSSPIENRSAKYRRERNGQTKRLHPGWTSSGNAAQLSINIINWLATPEAYTEFDSPEHPRGFATPEPMAEDENIDPDNGQPWSSPGGSYDPWDPNTFRDGAYGAKFPASSNGGGEIPTGEPISVAVALMLPRNQNVTVTGRVTNELNGKYGLELIDLNDSTKSLAVQVPGHLRAEFNPVLNPSILNSIVTVVGRREPYMTLPGLKGVTAISRVVSPARFATAENVDDSTSSLRLPRTIVEMQRNADSLATRMHDIDGANHENSRADVYSELRARIETIEAEIASLKKIVSSTDHTNNHRINLPAIGRRETVRRSRATTRSASEDNAEVETTIQIGTYNLELLGKSRNPFRGQNRPLRSRDDLKEIADRIVEELDLEIVVFQEINTESQNWRILRSLLAAHGYKFFEGTTSERNQFVVLAWDSDEIELQDGSLQELDVQTEFHLSSACSTTGLRKPVAGRFKAGSFDFWVVGVHLKSRRGSGSCPTRIRVAQSEELVEQVDHLIESSGESDVILLGDFNHRIGDRSFDPLTSGGFIFQTRFLTEDSGEGSYIKTFRLHESDDLIDHVLLRYPETREVVRYGTSVYAIPDENKAIEYVLRQSDHVPVWTSFKIDNDLDGDE